MRDPLSLHAGLNPKATLEQSCRTLSCALGAQEDAHRERVGTHSSSLRQHTEANGDTDVPAGTGPAPTGTGTSTVNAFPLKSYFSTELCVSLCPGPGRSRLLWDALPALPGACSLPWQPPALQGPRQGPSSIRHPPAAGAPSHPQGSSRIPPIPLHTRIHALPASCPSEQSQG